MLKGSPVEYALVGHSERRNDYGEPVELCAQRARQALDAGLQVVFCVGEKLEHREANKTMDVCIDQMTPLVHAIEWEEDWDRIVIAYEPVWAIGTGVTASPAQAQDTHQQLRAWIHEHVGEKIAAKVRIQYGGSVNAKNCVELMACPDIDGFLVGGASMKAEFCDVIKSGVNATK